MSIFQVDDKTFRYRDMNVLDDRNHCYDPSCEDLGKDLADFLARWENVGDVERTPADAIIWSCADHLGSRFEEAKRAFASTQRTPSAAYLTREEVRQG